MRHYTGNPSGDFMKRFTVEAEHWILAFRNYKTSFANLKLYAVDRVPNKANYWISFRKSSGRILVSRDASLLRKNRQELYLQAEAFLRKYYDSSRTN